MAKEESVFLTDDSNLARQLIEAKEAVIGIVYVDNPRPEQNWSGVSYIVELECKEDVKELEEWYLQEVWCRCHKKPVVIGTIALESLQETYQLRELQVEDVKQLYTLYEDEAIKRWIPSLNRDILVEKEKARAYGKYVYEVYGCGMWVLEEVQTGHIVGRVGIEPREDEEGLFLGYMIAKSKRRCHLAQQACILAMDYVQKRLEPDELFCKIHKSNDASKKLAEKLGFVFWKEQETSILLKKQMYSL